MRTKVRTVLLRHVLSGELLGPVLLCAGRGRERAAKRRGKTEGETHGAHDGCCPVEEVIADGAGAARGGWITSEVLEFLCVRVLAGFRGVSRFFAGVSVLRLARGACGGAFRPC